MPDDPRIAVLTDFSQEQAELLAKTLVGPDGRVLNLFATLAHHPLLLKRLNALGGVFLAHGSLRPREREIIILRTAFRAESQYEWEQHVVLAYDAGLTPAEIARVRDPERDGQWPARERALVCAVDDVVVGREINDATWQALVEHHEMPVLLELVTMIGFYAMLAALIRTIGIQVEEWVADRAATIAASASEGPPRGPKKR